MSSYEFGRVLGQVLPFVIGVALLVAGNRLHRATTRERQEAEQAHAALGLSADAQALPQVRGGKRRITGVVLVVLAVLGTVGQAVKKQSDARELDAVRVALPASLLGADRNDALLKDKLVTLRHMLPPDAEQAEVGYYGSGFGGIVVTAAREAIPQPKKVADEVFTTPISSSARYVSDPTPIDAGPLGGFARCTTATQTEPVAATGYACVFVSSTTFVLTVDTIAENLDEAGDRGRQIRSTVVSPTDNPLPPPSRAASPAPEITVTVRLPRVLLGATVQRKELAKERAEFLDDTKSYLTQADLGLYLSGSKTFVVEAAAGDLRLRSVFLRAYERQTAHELGSGLGAKQAVPPGALGGEAYCWHPVVDGSRAYLCLFVDDQAYVAVYDLESTRLASAADLARRVRAAVEKRH